MAFRPCFIWSFRGEDAGRGKEKHRTRDLFGIAAYTRSGCTLSIRGGRTQNLIKRKQTIRTMDSIPSLLYLELRRGAGRGTRNNMIIPGHPTRDGVFHLGCCLVLGLLVLLFAVALGLPALYSVHPRPSRAYVLQHLLSLAHQGIRSHFGSSSRPPGHLNLNQSATLIPRSFRFLIHSESVIQGILTRVV